MQKTGSQIFLDALAAAGVKYLFGNPGSTELPLNDAMAAEERIRYILGIQEIPVMGMADGYAQATRTPGVVNLHSACGLGNAMGMLYNAWSSGSPLIVTAGQQDRRLRFSEPVLEGDLVVVTRPWTKWSVEIQRIQDIGPAVRRAVQMALAPPTGPVFLSLPVDLQSELAESDGAVRFRSANMQVSPAPSAISDAAKVLLSARNPVILAGCRVTECGAVDELTGLAELIGAPVYSEMPTSAGRFPIAQNHPLYIDRLPYWSNELHRTLSDYDVAFIAGMDVFRLYIHHEPDNPIPDHLRLVHLDCNSAQIGKNYPVEVGVAGDVKAGLNELASVLTESMTAVHRQAALERIEQHARRRQEDMERLQKEIEQDKDQRPITSRTLISALAKALPPDAVFVDEAPSVNQNVMARLGCLSDPSGHFAHRGWALGWGMGCALGVKLARPERPVLGLLGDGAALYGIQGLWTAAHYNIPVTFVIANNTQYKILKFCGEVMKLPAMCGGDYVGMDITKPEIDFLALARGFGVEAHRVSEPEEITASVRDSFGRQTPLLLDVPIER